jgi:hypothetical protein
LNVSAVCLRANFPTAIVRVSKTQDVPANSAATTRVGCPAGSEITGGGLSVGTGIGEELFGSFAQSNAWNATIHNSTLGVIPVQVYALCSQTSLRAVGIQTQTVVVPSSGTITPSFTCGPNQLLTSGGFAGTYDAEFPPLYTGSRPANTSATRWTFTIDGSGGGALNVPISAVCLSY